ncbi:hypothetical protein [Mesorhizobium amorphae]|uniref:hypothetical protein n=1 Tax=Mesorhizobium amorphae TaxID=71433 RepID=UPI00177DC813|nr:hypothetical protein [Mesorhizobium amorphae]
MVEREKLELEARLLALELVVARIAAIQLIRVSDEQFDEFAQSWLDSADEVASVDAPPDQQQLWSGALGDSLHAMLKLIRETRGFMQSRA